MQFVDELRHMDGVKGNMAISESEYVATAVLQESQPVTQTIYSNAKAILEQHRYSTPEEGGGTISVILEENKNNPKEIIVKIKDTGIGIDSEIMPRLFTKFATKSEKGTGLGLYISKNIVEAHGGRIWAENNTDGEQGAKFAFSLPLSEL
jgi:signal transduction histidine kinase